MEIVDLTNQNPNPTEPDQKPNDIAALEAKNRELLGKLKETKDKFNELNSSLEQTKQKELEASGRYADINKTLKEKVAHYEKKLTEKEAKYSLNTINATLKQKALELGAMDADLVLKLIGKEERSNILVDDGYNVDESTIVMVLEDIKKKTEHIGLFKKKAVATKDIVPGTVSNTGKINIEDISDAQLRELYIQRALKK